MLYKEIRNIISLVNNNEIVRSLAILTILLSIVIAVFISFLASLTILLSYIFGFIVCWSLTKYQPKVSLYLRRFASFYRVHVSTTKHFGVSCPVCKNESCTRHQSHSNNPWKNLHITNELNDAVEHFYNRILETFIASWYKNFTNDATFLNELRVSLRYATSSVISRFLEIDTSRLIAKKLIPCAIKHVDDYLCMQQISKLKNVEVNDIAVEYLGRRLHVATTNRNNELSYLRHLTSSILPNILSNDYLKCKNYRVLIREIISGWVLLPLMDVLADPNMINSLVILITTYKSKGHLYLNRQSKCVEFLHNFINKGLKQSSFACDLKTVLKTTDLLYAFMQFLKREGSVHILQFCLDIEDFNSKLLTPDLSKKQLENLHTEAVNLYKIYFDHKSGDCIGCSTQVQLQLNQLLQEGVYNVAKLRTSEPLYQAYDYAFNILESEWLPTFFHSNEFYNYLCGSKITATYNKLSSSGTKSPMLTHGSPAKMRGKKYYEPSGQGTVAKISSGLGRIKGVLRSNQPVEGAIYTPDLNMYANGPSAFVEDILLSDCENIFRDLSAWRISIPSVETHQLGGGSKSIYTFNINVQRIDTLLEHEIRHWIVQRKDQDFYTLKTKLVEFHGENEICDSPLPSRRMTVPVETRRSKYEEFLRCLLQKPSLRGSDLLHTFLTTDQDFTLIVSATVPVVEDLGNIYQSVAFKLRKEKGQHLDSFMNTFLTSTGKPKQSKFEWAEMGDEIDISTLDINKPPIPATFKSSVFNNNFDIPYNRVEQSSSTTFHPNGITESLFYLLKHILKIRHSILRLFAAICSVAQQAVESICRIYIDHKLKLSLSQANLTDLIVLLEGVIFQTHIPSTPEDLKSRKERAFHELEQFIPHLVQKLLGNEFTVGLLKLLEILQNPLYNKQLAYNLLDIIAVEMYPQFNLEEKVSK